MKSKYIKTYLALCAAAAALLSLLAAPETQASARPAQSPWVEETIFLGETVPLRHKGQPLAQLCQQAFGDAQGEAELRWTGPQQEDRSLEELGCQAPSSTQDYWLTATIQTPEGERERRLLLYRVRVETGTVLVQVTQEGGPRSNGPLFRLEGQGLTVYRQALSESQEGGTVLEARFTGLPYGVYTVTPMEGWAADCQICRLGVCETDDTVDPARQQAVLRFSVGSAGAVGQCYRLEGLS